MLNTTTTRLVIVVALIGLLPLSTYALSGWLQPKEIVLPEWDIADLPLRFDSWQGVAPEPDARIRETILLDADAVADRAYLDDQNHVVSLHVALFKDLDAGVRHSPFNCYRGNGWREEGREALTLHFPDGSSIPVNLSTWEKHDTRVLVMYWYQLDDHILFSRWDLWKARVRMRSKENWPAMIKVLLETPVDDTDEAKDCIQTVAREVHQWLNGPHDQPDSRGPEGQSSVGQEGI
jgi:EpsI family protein